MVKITWLKGEVPKDLYVRQVYGIVFTNDGRLLLKVEDKKGRTDYNFPGGTPENYDTNFESTLRREFEEEVNTTLKKRCLHFRLSINWKRWKFTTICTNASNCLGW